MNHKIGLALGGGGARGSFQLGVIEVLVNLGILKEIKYVSGTSIGAINTLMIMNDLSYERMLEIWQMIDNSDIYGDGADRFKMDKKGIFSIQDLFKKLKKEISISEIKESKVKGFATTVKIPKQSLIDQVMFNRMEKEVLELNQMDDPAKGALASASMPVIFGTTHIDDDYYIDGGVLDNCPIQPLIEEGCDIIIAVPIQGGLKVRKHKDKDILIVVIEPHFLFNPLLIDVINFDPKEIPHRVEYGKMLAHFIFEKLNDEGVYDIDHNQWYKPEGFKAYRIKREEEIKLKFNQRKAAKDDKNPEEDI